jgi:hypothetical protein
MSSLEIPSDQQEYHLSRIPYNVIQIWGNEEFVPSAAHEVLHRSEALALHRGHQQVAGVAGPKGATVGELMRALDPLAKIKIERAQAFAGPFLVEICQGETPDAAPEAAVLVYGIGIWRPRHSYTNPSKLAEQG